MLFEEIDIENIHKDKMKILLIVNLCPHYRIKLFELLDKMYDIRFLFFSKGERYYNGARYLGNFKGEYVWGFNIAPKLRLNPKLIYELIRYPYTHLIAGISGALPLFLSFVISKIRRKKFIFWTGLWHHPTTLFHRFSFPFVKFIYRHSDAICVYGTHVKQYLVSLGIDEKKIFIAQKAVDNTLYNKIVLGNEVDSLKSELGIKDKKIILFVGRLEEVKGIDYLISALENLDREEICLVLIGRGSREKYLRHLATEKELDNILFLGYVDNHKLYLYYALADVFVLPSITTKMFKEPWGLVINEAMNQGCPIITTDAVGATAGGLVKDGVNGFVIPERDSAALKYSLEQLLENTSLRKKMSRMSKKIIKGWTIQKKLEGFKKAIDFITREKYAK